MVLFGPDKTARQCDRGRRGPRRDESTRGVLTLTRRRREKTLPPSWDEPRNIIVKERRRKIFSFIYFSILFECGGSHLSEPQQFHNTYSSIFTAIARIARSIPAISGNPATGQAIPVKTSESSLADTSEESSPTVLASAAILEPSAPPSP